MENCFCSLSRTGFPIFSARGLIKKQSCFCKMEAPPRIATWLRKLWIKLLADYSGYPLGGHHRENIWSCRRVSKERCHREKIKKETYEHFCIRVPYPLYNFPLDIIVQVIASMARRIDAVIKVKGQRTKYWNKSTLGDGHIFWKSLGKCRTFSSQ